MLSGLIDFHCTLYLYSSSNCKARNEFTDAITTSAFQGTRGRIRDCQLGMTRGPSANDSIANGTRIGLFLDVPRPLCVRPLNILSELPNQLQCELNLPGRCGGRSQQSRGRDRCPCRIKDGHVVRSYRHSRLGTIQDIKKLCTELNVEALRNALNVVVFEYGEIKC